MSKRPPVPAPSSIGVASILSARTNEPIVAITLGKESAQLDVAAARLLAMRILAAAEAAEGDVELREWSNEMELGDAEFAALLQMFRSMRARRWERDDAKGEPI